VQELCSTADVAFAGKKQDAAIRKGFAWLIDSINTNYDLIHKRVSRDVAVQKAEEEREKQEKRERVHRLREERCVGIFDWKQTTYLLLRTLGFVLMTLDWILNEMILDKYHYYYYCYLLLI
jgi:hypothetical protein